MQIVTLLSRGADGEACCADREVCACVFVDTLGLSASTVSHHMKALTEAGLVTSDKRGLWVYYRLVPETLVEVADELRALAGVGGAGAPAARSCCDTAKAGA
jgi:ArsR family transcriptional regulator